MLSFYKIKILTTAEALEYSFPSYPFQLNSVKPYHFFSGSKAKFIS